MGDDFSHYFADNIYELIDDVADIISRYTSNKFVFKYSTL